MMTEESLVNLPERVETYLEVNNLSDESESRVLSYDVEPVVQKKRKQKVIDSDSDLEDLEKENIATSANATCKSENEHEDIIPQKKFTKRMKIKMTTHSESESDSSLKDAQATGGNTYESERNKNKKKKLKDKFLKLKAPHSKSAKPENEKPFDSENNDENSEDEVSCLKIKQKIKKSTHAMSSICDPDTSDEDNEREVKQAKKKPKSRMTKPTSPKPLRMTAKQAMENMQKIKSESNRMLREKEVSLPYHRPKALTLKDILSRRKPAIAPDGKALPIKMNNEQLRQYAMMLEQRQKEVIELCKSDTEDEENPDYMDQSNNLNDENKIETSGSIQEKEKAEEENEVMDKSKETDNLEHVIDQCGTHQKDNITEEEFGSVDNKIQIKQNAVGKNEMDENEILIESNKEMTQDSREDTLDIDNQAAEKQNIDEKEIDENSKVIATENDTADITSVQKVVEKPEHDNINENDISMNSISEDKNVELSKALNTNMEDESQAINLKYDSEIYSLQDKSKDSSNNFEDDEDEFINNDYSFDEISKIIENAEANNDVSESRKIKENIHNTIQLLAMPKLTGGPGMVINLDNDEPASRKLSGVELLKERFSYFAKLKTPEDMEKEKEKKYKPGTQHLKLRQELENQIAEQRSIEWEKRLEEESRLKLEMKTLSDDDNDDIEKLEAKLEEIEEKNQESSEGEEEPVENDVIIEDKPMKRNPMMDDEAEVSEGDEDGNQVLAEDENEIPDDDDDDDDEEEEEESSDSSSEEEEESKPRKGRILKAFEDSDDESNKNDVTVDSEKLANNEEIESHELSKTDFACIKDSQVTDDELQLAQRNKSSDDLFSQESEQNVNVVTLNKNNDDSISTELGTQTFSIMESVDVSCLKADLMSPDKNVSETDAQDNIYIHESDEINSEKFALNQLISQNSQSQEIGDDIAAMCTGKFYDNPFVSQDSINKDGEKTIDDVSQEIGDDVAALCTGKFYDNPFVSQDDEEINIEDSEKHKNELNKDLENNHSNQDFESKSENTTKICKDDAMHENTVLKSILDELDEPEPPKQNKYFCGSKDSEVSQKKKFVIDSDDETNGETSVKKKKKLKKRKAEERALQFSDDEEDELAEEDYESNIEEDEERLVEYDSEENEVEVQQDKPKKKKRIGEFFENEAELTSEDEWIGSGDEDERGLDMMEREEGDDDTFHQGQLQRELGQIHMREVLDQDKREVRLIQELLFEDGDLGDGHRQRKFRWKNADGEIETGTNPDEFADTQEEEFESEEQWRKQRHAREIFLRQMQEDDTDLNTSINRTTIIKANLNSRSMSTLINETKKYKTETKVLEKKNNKDIPSPKKPFTIFQQNYHNSLLTRGRGALARLAALATPLAIDDATTTVAANGRNFVFSIKEREEPKVTKRKADSNVGTPRLIKKMKTEETKKQLKSTLFDLLKS